MPIDLEFNISVFFGVLVFVLSCFFFFLNQFFLSVTSIGLMAVLLHILMAFLLFKLFKLIYE